MKALIILIVLSAGVGLAQVVDSSQIRKERQEQNQVKNIYQQKKTIQRSNWVKRRF